MRRLTPLLFFFFPSPPPKSNQPKKQPAKLRRSFYVPVHRGPVKCVAAAAPFVATGGVDDTIHLFDVARHVDLGFLMSPGEGAVTSLALYSPAPPPDGSSSPAPAPPTHLVSGSADGGISIWSADREWDCLKTMAEAHSGPVSSISVHPSGRVFLSADLGSGGKGGTLRLWNLIKGKSQFKTRLPGAADVVAFAPGAAPETYALLCGDSLTVRSLAASVPADGDEDAPAASAGIVASFGGAGSGAGRQQAACWLDANVLVSGGDDGALHLWDARTKGAKSACRVARAHGARVKGVASMASGCGGGEESQRIASCATDGTVRLWDLRASLSSPCSSSSAAGEEMLSTPLASAEASGARLTCLAVVAAVAPDRAGVKLTPQQKSRRAKREAAAEAAAAAETATEAAAAAGGGAPLPETPGSDARPSVKVPNAKARRKALRKELLAKGGSLEAKKHEEREKAAATAAAKKQKREEKEKAAAAAAPGRGGAPAAAAAAPAAAAPSSKKAKKDKKEENKSRSEEA